MTDFQDRYDQDLRLAILQLLDGDAQGHEVGASLLHRSLIAMRFRVTYDRVVSQLDWLKDQGLLTTEALPKDVLMVKVKPRGRDVAQGLTNITGVTPYVG